MTHIEPITRDEFQRAARWPGAFVMSIFTGAGHPRMVERGGDGEGNRGQPTRQHFRDLRRSKRSVAIEDPGSPCPGSPQARPERLPKCRRAGGSRPSRSNVRHPLASGFSGCYASNHGALKTPHERSPLPSDSRFFCALRFLSGAWLIQYRFVREYVTPSHGGFKAPGAHHWVGVNPVEEVPHHGKNSVTEPPARPRRSEGIGPRILSLVG